MLWISFVITLFIAVICFSLALSALSEKFHKNLPKEEKVVLSDRYALIGSVSSLLTIIVSIIIVNFW